MLLLFTDIQTFFKDKLFVKTVRFKVGQHRESGPHRRGTNMQVTLQTVVDPEILELSGGCTTWCTILPPKKTLLLEQGQVLV